MNTHIINSSDEFEAGWINLGNVSIYSIGKKPASKRANINGLGSNSREALEDAINALIYAHRELYASKLKQFDFHSERK